MEDKHGLNDRASKILHPGRHTPGVKTEKHLAGTFLKDIGGRSVHADSITLAQHLKIVSWGLQKGRKSGTS